MVNAEEGKVGGAIEKVGQTDEGVCCLHVEKKDSGEEGHALDVANVGTVAGVRPQDVTKSLVVGTALWGERKIV